MKKSYLPYILALLLIGWTALASFQFSSNRVFWFDEIGTLRLAELPIGAPLWQAMTAGFEFNPPLAYVAVNLSEKLFGRGLATSRLPFLLAGIGTLILMFFIQNRQAGPWAGLFAIWALINTNALHYFSEARGYSFVLFGAVLAWYFLEHPQNSPLMKSLIRPLGIFAGLSIALLSHMWAIFLPPIFLAAILFQRFRNRSLDSLALLASTASFPFILIYVPLARASRETVFANPVYHAGLISALNVLLEFLPLYFFTLFIAWLAISHFLPTLKVDTDIQTHFPVSVVLASGFLCVPFLAYTITRITGAAFMVRYGLLFTVGAAMLLAPFFSRAFVRSHLAMQFVFLFAATAISFYTLAFNLKDFESRDLRQIHQTASGFADRNPNLPIFFSNGIQFLPTHFQSSTQLAQRLFLVADPAMSIKLTGSDGIDLAMNKGKHYFKIENNLWTWNDVLARKTAFILLTSSHSLAWLDIALKQAGYRFEPVPELPPSFVMVLPPTARP